MKHCVHLSSNWKLAHAEPGQGLLHARHTLSDDEFWQPATVPGGAHQDLLASGAIPDPFYATNYEQCLWMEDKDWWYAIDFMPPPVAPGQRLFLHFEGLDTLATVYLNGAVIGHHENMFTPYRIDITDLVLETNNHLAVCLGSVNYHMLGKADENVIGFAPRRLYVRKAQCCFGWDVTPRLVTVGIWRPVYLEVCDTVELGTINVRTSEIEDDLALLELEIELLRNGPIEQDLSLQIDLGGLQDELQVEAAELHGASTLIRRKFRVEAPRLWWPHDHGEPFLYRYNIALTQSGQPLDRREGHYGIRTVELVEEPLEDGGLSFYFRVNGRPIFLKGMNWTPFDAIFTRMDRAGYERLLSTACDCNINSLRVWGGAIYESEWFYNRCDELGILIWQDFMFACGIYPQNDAFLKAVREEAEYIVPALRSHPCLLVWCGDNECDWQYTRDGVTLDFRNNKITRQVLPEVCSRLDPDLPFIPSSPFVHHGSDPNLASEGDMHIWLHGRAYTDDGYLKVSPRLLSEIGHLAMPDMAVIESCIPEDQRWPVFNKVWRVHATDCLEYGFGEPRLRSLFKSIENNGLSAPQNLQELIEKTQQLQCDAVRCWIEHAASLPHCWGIMLWNLCDGWPQLSDAYIAYPFHPQPALRVIKECYGRIRRGRPEVSGNETAECCENPGHVEPDVATART